MSKKLYEESYIQDIADAIREKNGSTETYKVSEMAEAIENIPSGGEEGWEPQSDWWDIEKIVNEDTEDYVGKIIILLRDIDDDMNVNNLWGAAKIMTSDGKTITTTGNYTWDSSKDKECSLGYKTRYLIMYYTRNTFGTYVQNANGFVKNALYIIYKGIDTITGGTSHSYNFLYNMPYLECIKTLQPITVNRYSNIIFHNMVSLKRVIGGFTFTSLVSLLYSGSPTLNHCYGIDKTSDFDITFTQNITDIRGFTSRSSLKKVNLMDWGINPSQIESYYDAFANGGLLEIENLDFSSNTNTRNAITTACANLREIYNISNIKLSNFVNLSSSPEISHDSLIRVLEALYDYKAEGSTGTYTLSLGTTNLAKLTDSEKAIATTKGWTLS